MTNEDVKSELQKHPFIPLRLHLVSGRSVEVRKFSDAELMQNSVLVFQDRAQPDGEILYDMISLRNIERIEQLGDEPTSEATE